MPGMTKAEAPSAPMEFTLREEKSIVAQVWTPIAPMCAAHGLPACPPDRHTRGCRPDATSATLPLAIQSLLLGPGVAAHRGRCSMSHAWQTRRVTLGQMRRSFS